MSATQMPKGNRYPMRGHMPSDIKDVGLIPKTVAAESWWLACRTREEFDQAVQRETERMSREGRGRLASGGMKRNGEQS